MEKIWWLSFADGKRPEGEQFLGVVITQAIGFYEAVAKTHVLGVNPGGECQGIQITNPKPGSGAPSVYDWMDKLLSYDDMVKAGFAPERWTDDEE